MNDNEAEAAALRKIRDYLIESIVIASDQIKEIDEQLKLI